MSAPTILPNGENSSYSETARKYPGISPNTTPTIIEPTPQKQQRRKPVPKKRLKD